MTPAFSDYPAQFPARKREPSPLYRIRHDCFAGRADVPGHDGLRVLQHLPGDGLDVFAGPVPDFHSIAALEPRPVYSHDMDPSPAVPTGLVFVQGRSIDALEAAVDTLGFMLDDVPPYAPASAWIAPRDGSIATALSTLADLYRLAAVIAAEAQMLRPAARR